MATTPKVLLKRSSVAGRVPGAGDLDYGELAINFEDGKIYYKNSSNTISAFVDSARVQAIADAVEITAQAQLDSAEVIGLVDSAYVQARVPLSYLEGLIDSAYVNARITAHYDGFDSDFGTKTTDDLTEGSSNLYYVKSRVDSDIAASLNDSGNTVSITINNTIKDTVDSAYVLARVAAAPFIDSADAIQLIDSAYINARVDSARIVNIVNEVATFDSDNVNGIIDSQVNKSFVDALNVNADTLDGQHGSYYRDWTNVTNKPSILDTVDVSNIITNDVDKAFVDALNVDADTLDGYHATAFFAAIDSAVDALIDGAPGALDTLNELAAALNDDSDAYNSLLSQIAAKLDSAEAIALIDSAYVQARQDYAYNSLTGKPNILDSANVIALVTENSTDSAAIVGVVDSAYVQLRQDYAYSSLTGAPTNVSSFTNDAGYTTYDSTNTIGLVDSAYIQARQADIYRDSAFVTGIIDSAYINARVDSAQIITIINQAGFDSDNAIGLVDSAYVQQRVSFITNTYAMKLMSASTDNVADTFTWTFDTEDQAENFREIVQGTVQPGSSSGTNMFFYDAAGYWYRFGANVSATPVRRYQATRSGTSVTVAWDSSSTDMLTSTNNPSGFPVAGVNLTQMRSINDPVGPGTFADPYELGETFDAADITAGYYGDSAQVFGALTTSRLVDSADVIAIHNSLGIDSDLIIQLIDSSYVQARQITYDFLDSAEVINLVDSAYVQQRQDYAYSSLTGAPTNVSSFTNDANYIATGDSASLASVTTTGDVIVGGNLQVTGTTTTVNSEDLNVTDNMIYMNAGESSGSPTADIDVGWAANVNDNGSYTHVGMFRDASDDTFKVFGNYAPEPDASVQINTGHASFELAPFAAKTLTGEYLGFDSDLATKTTTDVTEGSNLYYTKARVDSDIDGRVTKSYVDALNIDADTLDGQTGTFYLDYDNFTNTPNILDSQNVIDLIDTYSSNYDSANTIALIDSAYIQARQADIYRDSGFVTNIIDSAYINARTSGIDSAAVTSIIDSAYVAARAGASGGAGTDSATVINLIQVTADSAYIQARQLNETAVELTQTTTNFVATTGQTSFTGLSIDSDKFQVYLNGLLLPRADYSHNSTQVDLVVAADSGDVLEVLKFTGNDTGATAIQQRHYIYTATSGQTVFTGADDNSATLSYTQGRINVYLNGLLLLDSDDYTQNGDGDTITFTSGVTAGHVVDIQTLSGNTGTYSPLEQTLYEFTADSGQTVFTGSDDNAATLDFSNDKITVYLNGILLSGTDYTPSGGDTITLDVGADSGNLLTVAKLSGNNIGLDSGQVNALIAAGSGSGTVDSAQTLSLINQYITAADSDLTTTTADQVIDTFSATTYRTAKYLVQFSHSPSYHSTEVLLVHDGTTVYMTEYAEVKTDSNLGTIDADISGGNVRLKVTPSLTNTGVNVTRINVTV